MGLLKKARQPEPTAESKPTREQIGSYPDLKPPVPGQKSMPKGEFPPDIQHIPPAPPAPQYQTPQPLPPSPPVVETQEEPATPEDVLQAVRDILGPLDQDRRELLVEQLSIRILSMIYSYRELHYALDRMKDLVMKAQQE